ncbi:MAG: A/G-specific adenine glycosylase [Fidelibacterota bacterium]
MKPFAERVMTWYGDHQRFLPWRSESDPYRIWVSEVMLQQTQVETVIPYYHRWLDRFPTVKSVAEAPADAVLKAWEGLGYYSRCRNFQRACRIVVDVHGSKIPDTWEELRKLPGVGDYTAGAILSFAFHKPYPALDGNVSRVMSRLLASPSPVLKGKKEFAQVLVKWIPHDRPGDFNQAMMDLGSQVCRKNQPHCFDCPVTDFCVAYQEGNPDTYPVHTRKKVRPHREIVVGVIWDGDRFLIQKRPPEGLLGGLWEFPGGKVHPGESPMKAVKREMWEETGLKVVPVGSIGTVDHAYSHFTITLHAFHCSLPDGGRQKKTGSERRWIGPAEVGDYPFPKANHKLFRLLAEEGWKPQGR